MFVRRLVAVLAALILAATALVATAPKAQAVVGNGIVHVVTGGALRVGCDWNKSKYHVVYNGGKSSTWCKADRNDTDWATDSNSKRCVSVIGVGGILKKRQGWYWIAEDQKAKVTDLTNWYVYTYSASKCGKRKYVNP